MPRKSQKSSSPLGKRSASKSPLNSPSTKSKRAPLTITQKKRNHIDSEKNRRNAIEAAFLSLSNIVPHAEGLAKSENKLLAMSLEWAKELINERELLHQIAEISGVDLSVTNQEPS